MSKRRKSSSSSTIRVSRNAKTGQFRVKPDTRDFRGGFQPRSKSPTMPQLPKSGSSVHVVTKIKPKTKKK